MKIQFTLNDATLDLVVAQIRTVLGAPYFMYNGSKFAGGKVTVHKLKDASEAIRRRRPMIHFSFNGACALIFYEGDTVISYDADKVVVKGEKEMTFTKTTVTAKEAESIAATALRNIVYTAKYMKEYWGSI